MTILLAEGFDQYGAIADMASVGWTISGSLSNARTPFTEGQSFAANTTATTYTWGSNEATVYGSVFFANSGTSSSSQYEYLAFRDAAANQCTIRWNADGSIGLYTGGPTGTLISTTSSVFTGGTSGPFSSFQFKIVISDTVGSVELRVNGSPTNTITATGVNTRGGTANAYVNGLAIAITASGGGYIDNLYLANSGWVGEMRALQQRPTTVSGTPNFSLFPTTGTQAAGPFRNTSSVKSANTGFYTPFVATISGTVVSATFQMSSNLTGHVKLALYDSTGTGGAPGNMLTTNSITNPVSTDNVVTLSGSVPIILGTTYYIAWNQDATATYNIFSPLTGYSTTESYSSFPINNPSVGSPASLSLPTAVLNITLANAAGVQQLIQDGDTSYIFAPYNTNAEDQYHLSPILSNYLITAVQYYAMWKKTDGGPRIASLSVDTNGSGDTTIISTAPPVIGTYTYTIKTMEVDTTGTSWTPTNVNNALLGVIAS